MTGSRMRVLHIASFYGSDVSTGGVARAADLLARGQARVGAVVTFLAPSVGRRNGQGGCERENREGVRLEFFAPGRGLRRFLPRSFFKAWLERMGDFDIVHLHGIWSLSGTWGAFAARRVGVPYVVSPQGMLNRWAMRFRAYKKIPYWYTVERHTVGGAAWIHFATAEEQHQAQVWIAGKRSKVIPIGLDLQEFGTLPLRGEFRDRHGISEETPLLAFLGRIHPIKGLDVLLRALVRVKDEVPEVMLAVAGPDEDDHASTLQGLAQDLGLEGRLRWLGTIEEQAKFGFLVDADLFVLPSFSENFGLAAVEAMAVGCPVVIGSGVNIAPQVEAYGAGWVVPTEPEALSSAIVAALRNADVRHAAGKAGQRLVAEKYDGENVAREMLKAYEECLG